MKKIEVSNKTELILDQFEYLKKSYIEIIINMIDYSITKNILPMKAYFMIKYIKDYINNNEIEILEGGIQHLLPNKSDILNFNIDNLDELDDNLSIKEIKNNINNNNNQNEILNLVIEIKNNSKKLNKLEIDTIKEYVQLLILVLEKIKILYE
jgi:hypothetical protein